MQTIPIGLDDEIITKLDTLVRMGIYKNRTEAIRAQIAEGLRRKPYLPTKESQGSQERIDSAVRWMIEHDKPLIQFVTQKTISNLIGEGRGR